MRKRAVFESEAARGLAPDALYPPGEETPAGQRCYSIGSPIRAK